MIVHHVHRITEGRRVSVVKEELGNSRRVRGFVYLIMSSVCAQGRIRARRRFTFAPLNGGNFYASLSSRFPRASFEPWYFPVPPEVRQRSRVSWAPKILTREAIRGAATGGRWACQILNLSRIPFVPSQVGNADVDVYFLQDR